MGGDEVLANDILSRGVIRQCEDALQLFDVHVAGTVKVHCVLCGAIVHQRQLLSRTDWITDRCLANDALSGAVICQCEELLNRFVSSSGGGYEGQGNDHCIQTSRDKKEGAPKDPFSLCSALRQCTTSWSCKARWITRFKGRAPKTGS